MRGYLKSYNCKIISVLTVAIFFLHTTAYGIDLSAKGQLRKPLDFNRVIRGADERYESLVDASGNRRPYEPGSFRFKGLTLILASLLTGMEFLSAFSLLLFLFLAPLNYPPFAVIVLGIFILGVPTGFILSALCFLSYEAYREVIPFISYSVYGKPGAVIERSLAVGIQTSDLAEAMMTAETPGDLFDLFKQKGLLPPNAPYSEWLFRHFALKLWRSAVRSEYRTPFPPSEYGEKFGLNSLKVKSGNRIFHVVGVVHGTQFLIVTGDEVRAMAEELRDAKIPLYIENGLPEAYGLDYGKEIYDQYIVKMTTSRYAKIIFRLVRHISESASMLYYVKKGAILQKIISTVGEPVPPCLNVSSTNVPERSIYQSQYVFADSEASPETVILAGFAHMDQVARKLREFDIQDVETTSASQLIPAVIGRSSN